VLIAVPLDLIAAFFFFFFFPLYTTTGYETLSRWLTAKQEKEG
jgi:hypothetical protein